MRALLTAAVASLCLIPLINLPATVTAQAKPETVEPEKTAKLPCPAEKVLIAKNGDLLVVKLQGKKLLGVVDVKKRHLEATIKTSTVDYLFAAGGNRAVVYDPTAAVFTTYDLDACKRIQARKSPFTGVVCSMVMGSNNPDFALLRVSSGTGALDPVHYERLDLATLTGAKLEGRPQSGCYRDAEQMRLSADGTFFCAWTTGQSPMGQTVGTVTEKKVKLLYEHETVGHILPLPGKHMAVTGTGSVISSANRVVHTHRGVSLYPDQTGAFYVGVNGKQLQVYSSASHQLINTINLPLTQDPWGRSKSVVMPFSEHKVLATLSAGGDAVDFYRFDPIGDLEKSDLDYLIVLSSPPNEIETGAKFEYTPKVATNAKSWSIEMLDSPDDAKVEKHKVVWEVPADYQSDTADFLLRISNPNEDEVYHEFRLSLKKKG